ncbi:unnamed protein product [Prorocentrum cordatum]|uniref:Uncharacterized protein n=1 Tax=Prorocentrum cordatum TaxID=2364126 RepID=A0ABN9VE49_9DINO|nr:unnamed protein product [Polarella glacialis]
MVVSFTWGVTAFGHVVSSWRGSCPALGLLVLGVCLAAASGSDTARKLGRRQLRQAQEGTYGTCCEDGLLVPADAAGPARGALRTALGCGCAVAVGLMNGTLMVPVTFFQSGSSTLGISGYKGNLLSPIAFLPSLSIGILCMQVPTFLIYFARDIYEGRLPKFQAAVAAAPGLVTGAYWAMGNFASMFAMTYLGQTIGFPLTQTCIVVGGLWGIFYRAAPPRLSPCSPCRSRSSSRAPPWMGDTAESSPFVSHSSCCVQGRLVLAGDVGRT